MKRKTSDEIIESSPEMQKLKQNPPPPKKKDKKKI
jgi:hypothetical protein